MAYKAVIIGGKHSGKEFTIQNLTGAIKIPGLLDSGELDLFTYYRQPAVSTIKDGGVVFYALERTPMTLTPIQEAICEVIRMNGIDALRVCALSVQYYADKGQWEVVVDGHTLTEHQYNEWLKEANDERKES